MPKKQSSTQTGVTGAAPARVAKPRTPRVKSAKHSKATPLEQSNTPIELVEVVVEEPPVVINEEITILAPIVAEPAPAEDPHTEIAKIAYGYWEARGYQPGDPQEDWIRAEREYRSRLAE